MCIYLSVTLLALHSFVWPVFAVFTCSIFLNQGSISISMSLHQTSFCFVCTHLTSGQKDGDELRRNSDVAEILRKTRFPPGHGARDEKSPETILDHEYVVPPAQLYISRTKLEKWKTNILVCHILSFSRIIWLGDLNYRIALSYRSVKALVEMHNWKQLLEKDQVSHSDQN